MKQNSDKLIPMGTNTVSALGASAATSDVSYSATHPVNLPFISSCWVGDPPLETTMWPTPWHNDDLYRTRRIRDDILQSQTLIGPTTIQLGNLMRKRLVQVIAVDTDDNVALAESIIMNETFLTDLNDEGIKLELNLKDILDKHNAKRAKMTRETDDGKTVALKPLKMNDVSLKIIQTASF